MRSDLRDTLRPLRLTQERALHHNGVGAAFRYR